MPLIAPIPTEGGPANPDKATGLFQTYWSISLEDAIFQVQQHKYHSYGGSVGLWVAYFRGRMTQYNGREYPEPFRIVIKLSKPWYCIGTAATLADARVLFERLTAITARLTTPGVLRADGSIEPSEIPKVTRQALDAVLGQLMQEDSVQSFVENLASEMKAINGITTVSQAVDRYKAESLDANAARRLLLPVIQSQIRHLVHSLSEQSELNAARANIQLLRELNEVVAVQLLDVIDEQERVLLWRLLPEQERHGGEESANAAVSSTEVSGSDSTAGGETSSSTPPPPPPPGPGPNPQPKPRPISRRAPGPRPGPPRPDTNEDLLEALKRAMEERRKSLEGKQSSRDAEGN